jgi:hypothetical protein
MSVTGQSGASATGRSERELGPSGSSVAAEPQAREDRAPARAIRSFVLRQGRMSPAQQRACDEL